MKAQDVCIEDGEPPDGRPASMCIETVHVDARTGQTAKTGQSRVPRFTTVSGFLTNSATLRFRRTFYKDVSAIDWNDWRWQLRHRITTLEELERMFRLSGNERAALSDQGSALPVAVTPYYASLLDPDDPSDPLRRSVIPTMAERIKTRGEDEDPLGEENHLKVPGLVHRYPDRVLFLLTDSCSTYCRYCTRSRRVGNPKDRSLSTERWTKALEYIESNPSVRDVLLSGGDPLTLPDDTLEWLLTKLRRIPHVEVVRIGTKTPAVLPQRITPALCKMLAKFHPLWMSIHCTHPAEHTEEMKRACERLANAGIPLQSQTVLLSGINDNVDTMRRLVHGLVKMRVRPYYIFQCDPIIGSGHFRTPVEKGLEIIKGLRGYTSGFAVPTYVIDCPGGGGKVPLMPDYVMGRDGDDVVLKNYEGNLYRYFDGDADPIH